MILIRKLILIFSAIIIPSSISAQEKNLDFSKLAVKLDYFGELVLHPGIVAGVDYTLSSKKWFNLHWDGELGGYIHKWNNNSIFVQSSIGIRFISSFSAYLDLNIGVGYMLSSPNGDVYSLNDQGKLTNKGRPHTSHFKPSLSLMFGWDGKRKKNIPLTIHFGVEASIQTGLNSFILPHAAFRLGATYQLKNKSL